MISSHQAIEVICEVFEVPRSLLESRRVVREAVDARFAVWHFLMRELHFSPQRVGRLLNRHRSNYYNALGEFDNLMSYSRGYQLKVKAVYERLGLEVEG